MNFQQRQAYKNSYLIFHKKLEKEFVPLMHNAIEETMNEFIDVLEKKGISAAKGFLKTYLYAPKVSSVISALFTKMALQNANRIYRSLYRYVKEFKKQRKKKELNSGAFGFNPEWLDAIKTFLQQYLLKHAVIPVTESIKRELLRILVFGQDSGWGIERIVQELRNDHVIRGLVNAQRIVRTELTISRNFADKLALDKIPFKTNKQWISSLDHRTRLSHRDMNGIEVESERDFHVPIYKGTNEIGVELMTGPGDPEASAGNVINCRCTLAYIPVRDKNGRLIPLQHKQQLT